MKTIFYLPLDLETTGFNGPMKNNGNVQGAAHNKILQVAGKILTEDFKVITEFDFMIDHGDINFKEICDVGNFDFHTKTGFWDKYHASKKLSLAVVEQLIVDFMLPNAIRDYDPKLLDPALGEIPDYNYRNKMVIYLLGKSVAFDRDFLNQQMPSLSQKLSHQIADVSSVRTLLYPIKGFPNILSRTVSTHLAMDDVNAAIRDSEVLREYMALTLPAGKWRTLEDVVDHLYTVSKDS